MGASFELPQSYKKSDKSRNNSTLPSGTLPQTLDFKLRHGKSTKLVDGRACGLHLRRFSASWLDAQSLLHAGRL